MIQRALQRKRGFSLIELMVAVTIFSIVMLISMGAILTIVDGNKKNQTMQIAINNLNFAVESMTRALKTGYNYQLDNTTLSACNDQVRLMTSEDEDVQYYLREHGGGNDNYGLYYQNFDTGYDGFITAPDLHISKLCFYEEVADEDEIEPQPSLRIVIQGETTSGKESIRTDFKLFTSVTQRQVQYD